MQALTNWDRKLHFILHELIKLRCYKDSLLSTKTTSSSSGTATIIDNTTVV
jgi:hypothetical protein